MGDIIEVLDEFTVQRRIRTREGKPKHMELCIIFPDYMDHDNLIVSYTPENDETANEDYVDMLEAVIDVTEYENK